MEKESNVREIGIKVVARVDWLKMYDPTCPRQLDGHDGRPSSDPIRWGRIKSVDDGMIAAVGMTARDHKSYNSMHNVYGVVVGIFRAMTVVVVGVFLYTHVWHIAAMFTVVFACTFALPWFIRHTKNAPCLTIPSKRKE